SHELESWIIESERQAGDETFFTRLIGKQDVLTEALRQVRAEHTDAASGDTEAGAVAAEETGTDREADRKAAAATGKLVAELEHSVVPIHPGLVSANDSKPRSGPQEMVKVSAALLDDLVNMMGETSISRGRIE